jgi:hypothetical protein
MATTTPLRFELGARLTKHGKNLGLPETPAGFRPVTGNYGPVAARAVQLNDVQKSLTHPDYVFFADTIGPDANPLHCDMCKRIAVHEASRDDD